MKKFNTMIIVLSLFLVLSFIACSSGKNTPLASNVDLNKFMGDWYVIANIPTFLEKEAYNAVESYQLSDTFEADRKIYTTFSFNKGSFDGKRKSYSPTGFVQSDSSNAVWKMQFLWPFKADYRIIHVDKDYTETIIGRNQRDLVWIMTREPKVSEEKYQALIDKALSAGYDSKQIKRVPQNFRAY